MAMKTINPAETYRIVPAAGWGYNLEKLIDGRWTFVLTGAGGQVRHEMACRIEKGI
jgi:hypothetical protein